MPNIVKYNNELNRYPVFKLTEVEQDIFMALLSHTTFNDSQWIEVNLYDLKDTSDYFENSVTTFKEKINSLLDKICSSKIQIETERNIHIFTCFDELIYDKETQSLKLHVQDTFYQMIKNYSLGFTRFELAEFVNLSGTYAKTLYRLLKQFRTSGSWTVEIDEFKKLLNIPDSYRQSEIDKQIFRPCIKQLTRELDMFDTVRIPFRHLAVEKIKKKGHKIKGGRGGTITHYKFTFDAEKLKELPKKIESQAEPKIVAETAVPIAEK